MLYFGLELRQITRSLYDYSTLHPETAFILSSRCEGAILTDYLDSCRNSGRYLDVVAFRKYLAREQ